MKNEGKGSSPSKLRRTCMHASAMSQIDNLFRCHSLLLTSLHDLFPTIASAMRKLTQGQRLLGILYKSGPVAQEEAREAIIGAAACSRNQARPFPPHGRYTFDATLLTCHTAKEAHACRSFRSRLRAKRKNTSTLLIWNTTASMCEYAVCVCVHMYLCTCSTSDQQ